MYLLQPTSLPFSFCLMQNMMPETDPVLTFLQGLLSFPSPSSSPLLQFAPCSAASFQHQPLKLPS